MAKLESKYGCRYSWPTLFWSCTYASYCTLELPGIDRTRNTNQDDDRTETEKTTGSSWPRLPTKIDIGTFLTAEQWMNWTNYFSIYCLRDLIPDEQMECWRHFVLASRRLCKVHPWPLMLSFCASVSECARSMVVNPLHLIFTYT